MPCWPPCRTAFSFPLFHFQAPPRQHTWLLAGNGKLANAHQRQSHAYTLPCKACMTSAWPATSVLQASLPRWTHAKHPSNLFITQDTAHKPILGHINIARPSAFHARKRHHERNCPKVVDRRRHCGPHHACQRGRQEMSRHGCKDVPPIPWFGYPLPIPPPPPATHHPTSQGATP